MTDGAAGMIVVATDSPLFERFKERSATITGFAHNTDASSLGIRDLLRSPSAAAAAKAAGVDGSTTYDIAELHAPFSHQELILRKELGLGDGTTINPSGGALAANGMFCAGLARIGEAASRIWSGEARTALAHATSGPALQQNLVCVLEGAA